MAQMKIGKSIRIRWGKNLPYVYRWTNETEGLLPEHYKQRCIEFMTKDPTPVHWRPNPNKYIPNPKTGERVRVQNVPVTVLYPAECNKGLWGGEGIVAGYRKKHERATKFPKIWRPSLQKRVLYSEILNKHFLIAVTLRTMDLIDDHFGFDNYILKTHEVDLCSKLGMDIKREMLVALATKSIYPDDPVKRDQILEKYKDFIMPVEEAEWVGLSVPEALRKAREAEAKNNPPRPLKDMFIVQLAQKIAETGLEDTSESFISKLNPFTTKPLKTEEKP
ncbi:hypothetical protein C0Q70_05827 [Pomacea canaliculata]|uniref:Large ribosomal subunit protein bL28m n=1 Tax=Pomacea canaliculata TaxID=400727 RepID=A0A2T7PMC7_POMCA|nr:39S ribosomal protein L28, mitochondrial-like [Pomacea canaliculata]PVD34552.1 hypothetical protein C0Q70_05827 [Pomacea canaliculata]